MPFAGPAQVQHALSAAAPAVKCTTTTAGRTDVDCAGPAPGLAATQVDIHTDPQGQTAEHWFVTIEPARPPGIAGPTPADTARYVASAADTAAAAGIVTATERSWLRAHASDPEVEADLGGHHLVVSFDSTGNLILTVEPIALY